MEFPLHSQLSFSHFPSLHHHSVTVIASLVFAVLSTTPAAWLSTRLLINYPHLPSLSLHLISLFSLSCFYLSPCPSPSFFLSTDSSCFRNPRDYCGIMTWMGFNGYVKQRHKIQNNLLGLDMFCRKREEVVDRLVVK